MIGCKQNSGRLHEWDVKRNRLRFVLGEKYAGYYDFDANGHLTHIDINSGHLPARMPALYNEDGEEEEKRFAEYYSFTISGLSPDTRYYYTRQSFNGTEVIDEETGSFETQSNEPTGLNGCDSITPAPHKFLENGQMLIRSGNATYNVQGKRSSK